MRTLRLVQEAVDSSGTHRIAVELEGDGPRRTATAQVRLALDQVQLERVRWYLEDYLEYPIDPAPTIASQVEQGLVELGRNLFDQVFGDREAKRLWDKAEPRLAGTRVEVVTDVEGATSIPWELLRDPLTNTPLALRAGAFVRTNPQPARLVDPPDQGAEQLRILLVICRPAGADDVPFRSVASHLVRVSDDARQTFDLDVLRPPTFAGLGEVLRAAADQGQPYHVVHFDGHGTWTDLAQAGMIGRGGSDGISNRRYGDPRGGAHGYLLFEEPEAQGNVRYINGPELGDLLAQTGVPVLVLNACRSAHADLATTPEEAAAQVQATREDPHERVRAYGSLAQEVIEQGVAGVVAMRYNVYVVTAARFVAELYASLLAGHRLGEAVSRGRLHLFEDPTREVSLRPMALQDWMVPIVYETASIPVVAAARPYEFTITVPQAATGRDEPEDETRLPGPPDVGFYGRDETLLALDRAFDTQPLVLLHAYAGAGKTTTAAEFARWYQRTGGLAHDDGDGLVLFTAFTQRRPLTRVLDQIGQTFGDALQGVGVHWDAMDDAQRRHVAMQVLDQVPVLWIWDNVEPVAGFPEGTESAWSMAEQDDLRGFLADLRSTKARVLLTSRREERAWLGELPARVRLPPMPMAERVQLARAVAEKHNQRLAKVDDWRLLLAYTQGNPLTITVLVGQALRDGLRTRDHVEAFVARLQAGEATLSDDEQEGRTKSLGASLGYGFEHAFDESERAQLALLHLFQGFVDADTLRMMGDLHIAKDAAVPALAGLNREQAIALLDRATEVGLLSGYGDGYYAIHPALPWYFTELFTTLYGQEGSSAVQQATHAYTRALAVLGGYYTRQWEEGRRAVIGALAAEEANLLHARRLARTHGWWEQVIDPTQALNLLYEHTGRRVEWARLIDELVPDLIDPATDGPKSGRESVWSVFTDYRVRLARQKRDWATAERLQRAAVRWDREQAAAALRIPSEELTRQHWNLIRTLAVSAEQLGHVLREQGRPECVEAYIESLELSKRINDRPGEAVAAFNLGNAYVNIPKLRDLDAAERWYQYSLDLRDEADHLARARTVGQLGRVHHDRFVRDREAGRPDEELLAQLNAAASAYEQALKLLPPEAVDDLAVAHSQLGLVYDFGNQFDRAFRHYQQAIRLREAAGNRFSAANARFNVALALIRRGQPGDALLWAQAALRDYQSYGDRATADITRTQQFIAAIEQAIVRGGA